MTPYRYCVKHRLVEGRWWWCPGYHDDKGKFWTVGYWQTRRLALQEANGLNRKERQVKFL
jgi:hypothetical protein